MQQVFSGSLLPVSMIQTLSGPFRCYLRWYIGVCVCVRFEGTPKINPEKMTNLYIYIYPYLFGIFRRCGVWAQELTGSTPTLHSFETPWVPLAENRLRCRARVEPGLSSSQTAFR